MAEIFEKIKLSVDSELRELIPDYLEKRQKDVALLSGMLEQGDFAALQAVGHRLRGTGGAYGFAFISDIGRTVEMAAKKADLETVKACVANLAAYLQQVEITYQ